jgi:hypothetical protein
VKFERLIPLLRDLIFLAAGTYIFLREALASGRTMVLVLAMLFAAGPAVLAAVAQLYLGRTQGNDGSPSPPPPSPESSPPSVRSSEDPP